MITIKNDMSCLDLSDTNFMESPMHFINLFGSNLNRCCLAGTYLRGTDARYASFIDANCKGAIFVATDLKYANLMDCDFSGADLSYADLRGANITDACFEGANMYHTLLDERSIVPDAGGFTGYAAINGHIVTLFIPSAARRLSPLGSRVCRCDKALITNISGGKDRIEGHRESLIFVKNELLEVTLFDHDARNVYGEGIRFYLTFREAREAI